MPTNNLSLKTIFDGWNAYHLSIVHAVEALSTEQLLYRPAAHLRSVGEISSHIGLGRIAWFERMDAPKSKELAQRRNWPKEWLHWNRKPTSAATGLLSWSG